MEEAPCWASEQDERESEMSYKVGVNPSRLGALSFWAGSDHYSLSQALKRERFFIPIGRVSKVYEVRAKPLIGLGSPRNYAVEYSSGKRDCFITMEELPAELRDAKRIVISPLGAMRLVMSHLRREPTVLFLPLLAPFFMGLMIGLFSLWNDLVLHNPDVLAFFANPACEANCVRKVLSIHSLVGLLFLLQITALLFPLALWYFQAPRYRSVVNYRVIQGYSLAGAVVGAIIFVQLMFFFPFRQYTRFVEMGFGPKAERLLSNLNNKK